MAGVVYATISWIVCYAAAALVGLSWALGASRRVSVWISLLSLTVSSIASSLALLLRDESLERLVLGDLGYAKLEFMLDGLSAWVGFIVSMLSLLIGVYSVEYMGEEGGHRYWFFYNFFVGSMLLLVYAGDLLLLLVGWEGTGLASYALIGYYLDDRRESWVGDEGRVRLGVPMWFTPSHSAIRALVFTGIGDTAMMVALGMLVNATGSTSITTLLDNPQLLEKIVDVYGAGSAALFTALFFAAALAKSAQFPFHEWLVTAMTGPTSISALIHAATMVKAGVYLAARFAPVFYSGFGDLILPVLNAYAWIAMVTALLTALMALVARELKLILAYSTASQLGYMLAAAFSTPRPEGAAAATLHLISHAVFKAALFLIAGFLIHELHTRYVTEMRVSSSTVPLTAAAALLAGASLAGIPPLAGFWSKDAIVVILPRALRVVALATAALTAFYTTRMLLYAFNMGGRREAHEAPLTMLVPYATLAVLSLGFGLSWNVFEHIVVESLHAKLHVDPRLAATSASLSLAGVGVAIILYDAIWRLNPPTPRGMARVLYELAYDRFLVNPVLYRAVVYPGARVSRFLASKVERVIDALYHRLVPSLFTTGIRASAEIIERSIDSALNVGVARLVKRLGEELRSMHTGDLSRYLITFITGVVVVALLVAWYTLGGG